MPRYRDFAPQDRLPATWTDAIEELVGNYLDPNFRIVRSSSTTLTVPCGAGDAQISVAIDGKPRWRTTDIVATHPGGGASTLAVNITASVDSFGTDSNGFEVDNTTHTFGLKIGTPSGTGAEALSRQVGTVTWSGTAITAVQMDRDAWDAYRVFTIGDVSLYRSAADIWKTDDAFSIGPITTSSPGGGGFSGVYASPSGKLAGVRTTGQLIFAAGLPSDTTFAQWTVNSDGKMEWLGDCNLYRLAADSLKTDDALTVAGAFSAEGNIRLGNATTDTVGFFDVAGTVKKTGYGSGSEVTAGTKGALTASSTMNDILTNLSSLIADARGYGFVGA